MSQILNVLCKRFLVWRTLLLRIRQEYREWVPSEYVPSSAGQPT